MYSSLFTTIVLNGRVKGDNGYISRQQKLEYLLSLLFFLFFLVQCSKVFDILHSDHYRALHFQARFGSLITF